MKEKPSARILKTMKNNVSSKNLSQVVQAEIIVILDELSKDVEELKMLCFYYESDIKE